MNTVVFGIGNRLMMDDGIGVYVVEKLNDNFKMDNIIYIIGETDFDYCLDYINDETDFVIIVDALYENRSPGDIAVYRLEKNNAENVVSQHSVNLIDIIKQNYKKVDGYIIGIQAAEINFGVGLSECLGSSLDKITYKVSSLISALIFNYSAPCSDTR